MNSNVISCHESIAWDKLDGLVQSEIDAGRDIPEFVSPTMLTTLSLRRLYKKLNFVSTSTKDSENPVIDDTRDTKAATEGR